MLIDPDGSGELSNGGLFDPSNGGLSDPGNVPGGPVDPSNVGVVGGLSDPSYIGVGGGLLSYIGVGGGMAGGETVEDLLLAGNRHDPELGSLLVVVAVPPKLQLVGAGFFW